MGGLCFMLDGRMCCSVSGRGGLLIRVGATTQDKVLREAHVRPMEMRGRTVAGFVRVASDGYSTDAALKKWIDRGLTFLATLPPKQLADDRR